MLFLLKTKVGWPADYSPEAMSSLRNTAAKNLAYAGSILRNLVALLLPSLRQFLFRRTAVAAVLLLGKQQLVLSCAALCDFSLWTTHFL